MLGRVVLLLVAFALGIVVLIQFLARPLIRLLTGPRRYAAVENALLAKVTLPTLDTAMQEAVVSKAKAIYAGEGKALRATAEAIASVTFDHMSEFEQYSLYSTAMMELHVQPCISEPWGPPPRNPFTMKISERDVAVNVSYLKRHFGVDTALGIARRGR